MSQKTALINVSLSLLAILNFSCTKNTVDPLINKTVSDHIKSNVAESSGSISKSAAFKNALDRLDQKLKLKYFKNESDFKYGLKIGTAKQYIKEYLEKEKALHFKFLKNKQLANTFQKSSNTLSALPGGNLYLYSDIDYTLCGVSVVITLNSEASEITSFAYALTGIHGDVADVGALDQIYSQSVIAYTKEIVSTFATPWSLSYSAVALLYGNIYLGKGSLKAVLVR